MEGAPLSKSHTGKDYSVGHSLSTVLLSVCKSGRIRFKINIYGQFFQKSSDMSPFMP